MPKLAIPFGNPATYPGHSGVDFPGHAGEPIPASAPGVVTWLGQNDRGGFFIWVQYDDGPHVGYHHMNSHDGCPSEGRRVTAGQRLGYVGWTGHVVPAGRAGAHLHSEVDGHRTTEGYWQFFDRDRVVGSGAAGGGNTTGDDMSVNDIYNARDSDNRNMLDLGRQARADIAALRGRVDELIAQLPTRVWQFPIQAQDATGRPLSADGRPVNYAAHGYLASTVAQLGAKLGTAEVDEQALAVALAPLLATNMTALSDADVKRIATAAADEQARRLQA